MPQLLKEEFHLFSASWKEKNTWNPVPKAAHCHDKDANRNRQAGLINVPVVPGHCQCVQEWQTTVMPSITSQKVSSALRLFYKTAKLSG